MFWDRVCQQEEKHIWCSETGTSPQMLCMVASGKKLAGRRQRLRKKYSCIWEHLLQGLAWNSVWLFFPLVVLNVPAWMFMSGLTLRFLHCVLNITTGLCPLWSQNSASWTTDSWTYLWRWRCASWGRCCSQYCFDNIYIPSTPVPFLGLTDPVPSATTDVMENPEKAQVTDMVCEGFIRPGPVSCSWTWDRTPRD
jgi:hypothetical protein